MLTIAVVTNLIPSYRRGFYRRLFAAPDVHVTVFCQRDLKGVNVKSIGHEFGDRVRVVDACVASGERLSWQFLPFGEISSDYDVVFVDGNPRNLSHAVLASVLRAQQRPLVLWTMARSFRGNRATEAMRLGWSRLFPNLFVYTDDEVALLRSRGFKKHNILAQNNGLDQVEIAAEAARWTAERLHRWRVSADLCSRQVLLTCTRLVEKNRIDLALVALQRVRASYPDVMFCIIGEGDERTRLERLASHLGVTQNVRFVGAVYDEDCLAPYFLSSVALLHPGAIGLTLLHAFGYGLPVITHDNGRHHGPEFTAFVEDGTGRTFREGDAASLAERLADYLSDANARARHSILAREIADTKYNCDVMAARFLTMARSAVKMGSLKPQDTSGESRPADSR